MQRIDKHVMVLGLAFGLSIVADVKRVGTCSQWCRITNLTRDDLLSAPLAVSQKFYIIMVI